MTYNFVLLLTFSCTIPKSKIWLHTNNNMKILMSNSAFVAATSLSATSSSAFTSYSPATPTFSPPGAVCSKPCNLASHGLNCSSCGPHPVPAAVPRPSLYDSPLQPFLRHPYFNGEWFSKILSIFCLFIKFSKKQFQTM